MSYCSFHILYYYCDVLPPNTLLIDDLLINSPTCMLNCRCRLVVVDVAFYTENVQALKSLERLDMSMAEIWEQKR